MELDKEYDDETAAAFGRAFIRQIEQYPLGGMSKRDLDCLVFYLLKKYELIPGETNRERAYSLNISESRYRSYLVDSDAKFKKEHDQKASVERIFRNLENGESGASMDGDMLVFFEEDPVAREDFMQEMKSEGFYTDTSFNKEIIRVRAVSFLLYALDKGLLTEEKVLDILNKDKTDKEEIKDISNAQMSLADFFKGGYGIVVKNGNMGVTTIAEVFEYVGGVAAAKMNKKKSAASAKE